MNRYSKFLLVSALLCVPLLNSQASSCQLVADSGQAPLVLGKKKLSVFWSQEYSGSDLVKSEMAKIPWASDVKVALYDSGFEREFINVSDDIRVDKKNATRRVMVGHHGTNVANIINGPSHYGSTDKADYMALRNVYFSRVYVEEFEKYQESGIYPRVISNSYGWSNSLEIQEQSFKARDNNVMWFLAAGNDYPTSISEVEDNSGAILVGSYAPSGLQSAFSQISDNVVILSPADDMQASIDGKGRHNHFGGTSGATPLVAANAINIISILPEIRIDQYTSLLKKTALPSFEQVNEDKNAPGLFNGYKAFRVAFKVATKCQNKLVSQDKQECVELELNNDENYIFSSSQINTDSIYDESAGCEERKAHLMLLRKKTLLENRAEDWQKLAQFYTHYGFEKNAEFAHHMARGFQLDNTLRKELQDSAIAVLKEERFFDSYFRYQHYFDKKYQLSLASMLVHDPKLSPYWLSSFLVRYGENLDPTVVDYLNHSLKYAREDVVEYIYDVLYR